MEDILEKIEAISNKMSTIIILTFFLMLNQCSTNNKLDKLIEIQKSK